MNATSHNVGKKIRRLRKQKGLTLAEMASLCQCSSSLLSQIETGVVNPSFSTLKALSDALGTSLASLVSEDSPVRETFVTLMEAKERKVLTTEGGVKFHLLSRSLDVPFEFILNQWPPGSSTGKDLYTHEGEECGLVLEGELEVEVDGTVHHIKPGDTITLHSSIPHRVSNPGKKEAMAVWVNPVPWMFSTK